MKLTLNLLKRILLLIPLLSFLFIILKNELIYDNILMFTMITINFLIIFINFPIMIHILHTTPVYYEDLQMIGYNTSINVNKLQNIFLFLNGFTGSIFIGLLFIYIINNINKLNFNLIELLSIIGGLLIVYIRIQTYIGKIFLSILYKFKKNYNILNGEIDIKSLESKKIVVQI